MKEKYFLMDKEQKIQFFRDIFNKKIQISLDEIYELTEYETDKSVLCVIYVVMGKLAEEADVLKVCRGLKHSEEIVRRHAVIGLGLINSEFILTFLLDVLEDNSLKVQSEAYNICKKINPVMMYEYVHHRISQEKDHDILKRYLNLFRINDNEKDKKIAGFIEEKLSHPFDPEDVENIAPDLR